LPHKKLLRLSCYAVAVKRKLMEILACPVCKNHPLDIAVTKEDGGEIISGTITCSKCGGTYPIEDSIPNMLPQNMR